MINVKLLFKTNSRLIYGYTLSNIIFSQLLKKNAFRCILQDYKKLVLLTKLSLKLSILFLNFIKNSLHKITIYIEFTGKMHVKEQHKKGRNRESETERRNKNL